MLSTLGPQIRAKVRKSLLLSHLHRRGRLSLRLKNLLKRQRGLEVEVRALRSVTIKWPASARHRPHFDLRCTPRKSQSRASRTPRLGRAALLRPRRVPGARPAGVRVRRGVRGRGLRALRVPQRLLRPGRHLRRWHRRSAPARAPPPRPRAECCARPPVGHRRPVRCFCQKESRCMTSVIESRWMT